MHGEYHARAAPRLTTAHLKTKQNSLSLAPCCRVSGSSTSSGTPRLSALSVGEFYVVEDLWMRKSLGSCCASKEISNESEPAVCSYFKKGMVAGRQFCA